MVRDQIKAHRSRKLNIRIQESGSSHPPNIWKLARRLRQQKRKIPSIKTSNGLLQDNQEKADFFAERLAQVFTNSLTSPMEETVNRSITSLSYCPTSNPSPITPEEINSYISKLKPKSAPGHDGITNKILKNLPSSYLPLLSNLFNSCLSLSYFPSIWKHANIILLPKPSKPSSDPNSYRPISLLSSLGKLFERTVLARLKEAVTDVIPDHQMGFRERHSATHQLVRLIEKVAENLSRQTSTAAVFLDVEKAFDRAWPEGLIHKLSNFPIPIYITKILSSFLTSRTFTVSIDNITSTKHPILAGVPQGSILSPILYNLFTSDLPSPTNTHTFLYADDVVVASHGVTPRFAVQKLKPALQEFERWEQDWKTRFNPQKSSTVIFSAKKKFKIPPAPNIRKTKIPIQKSVKYLGLTIDEKILFKSHIENQKKKATSLFGALNPIYRSKAITLKEKINLFQATSVAILLYGAPAWAFRSQPRLAKLNSWYHRCLRRILRAPWFVRNAAILRDLRLPTFTSLLRTNLKSFQNSLPFTKNPLLTNLWNYDPHLTTPNTLSFPRPKSFLT
jgi:retron-type reverse transcriptase